MEHNTDLLGKYDFVVDTLKMLCTNFENSSDNELADYLEEIEGDHHTFFDQSVIKQLLKANLFNDLESKKTMLLKSLIGSIPPNMWNVAAFKIYPTWIEARVMAQDILNSLGL